jgi:hypothetical protein
MTREQAEENAVRFVAALAKAFKKQGEKQWLTSN